MDIIKNLKDKNYILNIYPYGSRVYGVGTEKSDYDYVVVIEDEYYSEEAKHEGNTDVNFYKKSEWMTMCKNNDLVFCECYFLPSQKKIKEKFKPNFILDRKLIRSNFSKIASNSYVKCKKKLTIPADFNPYVGKKSLWHSFRILMFGIQILSSERITDYSAANDMYDAIINSDTNDWNYFKAEYQKKYNALKSEFRKFDRRFF